MPAPTPGDRSVTRPSYFGRCEDGKIKACSDRLLMKNNDVRRSLGSGLVEAVSRASAGHHHLHLSPDDFWNAIVTGTHICLSNPRLGLVSQVYSEEHYRSRMYSDDYEDYQATAVKVISRHAIANLDTPIELHPGEHLNSYRAPHHLKLSFLRSCKSSHMCRSRH
jgi:hypothetical protein